MKNIYAILTDFGIEIPEDKKADFDKAVTENYKTVAEADKLRTARDNYKDQLDTAQNALKEFEGVDVNELNGKITTLTNDLASKETEYQTKISDMEFNGSLDSFISSAGARNAKAVKALLDIDTLKASKNQTEDIKSAIEALKTDNDYLFAEKEPIDNPVGPTRTGNPTGGNMAAIRAAMGLSETK